MITNTQGPETNCSFVEFPVNDCKMFVFCKWVFFLKSIYLSIYTKNSNSSIENYSQFYFFLKIFHKK